MSRRSIPGMFSSQGLDSGLEDDGVGGGALAELRVRRSRGGASDSSVSSEMSPSDASSRGTGRAA